MPQGQSRTRLAVPAFPDCRRLDYNPATDFVLALPAPSIRGQGSFCVDPPCRFEHSATPASCSDVSGLARHEATSIRSR